MTNIVGFFDKMTLNRRQGRARQALIRKLSCNTPKKQLFG
jgi:hypothetical protein